MDCLDITVNAPGATNALQSWLPVIGSAIVGAAALIGVLITVSRTRRSFLEELSESRRAHQREVIADLVVSGTRLHETQGMNFVAVPFMSSNDLLEWVDTDTSKLQRKLIAQRDRALIRARIEVRTASLKPRIDAIADALKAIEDAGPDAGVMASPERSHGERYAAGQRMKVLYDALNSRTIELREAAIDTLPVEIDAPSDAKKSRWRKGK
jgi:hypothetical protein